MPAQWSALGSLDPAALVPAREALHAAVQPVAAAAYALLEAPSDHSHANLFWSHERDGFVGRPLPGGARAGVDVAAVRAVVLDASGGEAALLELEGNSLEQARTWLEGVLRVAGADALDEQALRLPPYDLPDTPWLAEGATFPESDEAHAELARWFGDAALVLDELAREELAGVELRGWPHHFDLAALHVLDEDADPEQARSLGAGFSPGDQTLAAPYFYVTPWPRPDAGALPALDEGACWHTEGFTSAVLDAGPIVAAGDAAAQERFVRDALREAVRACRELVGG